MSQPAFVLASTSPQRRRLLSEAGYQFQIVPPQVIEPDRQAFTAAAAYVEHTAWLKAQDVVLRTSESLVVAADTVVTLDGAIIGKPADVADARRIIQRLSGTEHEVLTGVCIWYRPGGFWIGAFDRSRLKMQELTEQEIERYLTTDRWVDKAGAYAIQDPDPYVSIIEGSFTNVVGMPLELLERLFKVLARIV